MKSAILLTILLSGLFFTPSYGQIGRLAVQGSSTANGFGIPEDSSFAGRLKKHYMALGRIDTLHKVAASSLTCYEGMPTGYVPPAGRPAPNVSYNITRVLSRTPKPTIVIVNYPSNGYDYMTVEEVVQCLKTIKNTAESQGVRCFITTTQPRDGFSPTEREKLRVIRDSIMVQFGDSAIDFWTPVVNPATNTIRTEYAYGDGIHLNALGHKILFDQVVAKNLLDNTLAPPQISIGSDIVRSFVFPNVSLNVPITIQGLQKGRYTLSVKLQDSLGGEYRDTSLINIVAAPNVAPVANAGTDRTITLPTNSLTLQGAGTDSDGTIVSWLWTQVSGPNTAVISTPTLVSTNISGLIQGTYQFQLTLSDNNGALATDIVQVTVNPVPPLVNLLPTVNAGVDQTIQLPTNSTNLSGNAVDSDGTISSYSWTLVSGPATFTLVSPNLPQTQLTNLEAGTYSFRLQAMDNAGGIGADTVIISVLSTIPPPPVTGSQRVLVDLGMTATTTPSPDQWGKYWNNMTDARAGVRVNNAVAIDNVPTTIKVDVVRPIGSTASYDNNMRAGDGVLAIGGQYPASATNDHAFANSSVTNGQWRIYGLDPTRTYTVKFWGSRNSSGSRFIQIKRADETVWKEYNASLNTNYDSAARFTFTGTTEMYFDIRVKSGSTFSYINVLDISSVSNTAAASRTIGVSEETTRKTDEIQVSPNPGSGRFTFKSSSTYLGQIKFFVTTNTGEIVLQGQDTKVGSAFIGDLDLTRYSSGSYYLTVVEGSKTRTVTLIKE